LSIRDTIITYRSLQQSIIGQYESAPGRLDAVLNPDDTNMSRAEMAALFAQAMTALEEEESDVDGVMVAPRDELASLLQTWMAKQSNNAAQQTFEPLDAGGLEAKFDNHDILGWVGSLFSWIKGIKRHPLIPAATTPDPFPDKARIAVLSDWGTGLYGAPECAKRIEEDKERFWMVMHLGDVYYSGDDDEIQERFLDVWPKVPSALNRGLNGNHEMYTGGNAYFKKVLSAFQQPSSYCAFQNENFLLVGLDTAQQDNDLAGNQVEWLQGLVKQAGDRKLILLSHHQPFSLLDKQGPKLVQKLAPLLEQQRIFAWYWGHEHRCVFYDRHPLWGLYGRVIGHSGFPYFRDKILDKMFGPVSSEPDMSHKLAGKGLVPGGLILQGPNPYLPGQEKRYGPNGYVVLEFDGGHLYEVAYEAGGKAMYENQLA